MKPVLLKDMPFNQLHVIVSHVEKDIIRGEFVGHLVIRMMIKSPKVVDGDCEIVLDLSDPDGAHWIKGHCHGHNNWLASACRYRHYKNSKRITGNDRDTGLKNL